MFLHSGNIVVTRAVMCFFEFCQTLTSVCITLSYKEKRFSDSLGEHF